MRYEPFKKQVMLESGIIMSVLVVLLAIVYLLSSIRDDYIETNQSAQRVVDGIDAELNTLKGKYSNILQNAVLYQEVQKKQSEGMLAINRQMVLEKFNQYKTLYSLNNLRLSVAPIQDVKDGQYKRKTSLVSYSEVNIDLDVLSDESVFELLDTMPKELSGVSKITRVTMSREKPLGEDVLGAIRQRGTYPLIKTGIRFVWFSINPVDSGEASPDAKK
jgi:hypothetical protein